MSDTEDYVPSGHSERDSTDSEAEESLSDSSFLSEPIKEKKKRRPSETSKHARKSRKKFINYLNKKPHPVNVSVKTENYPNFV